MRVAAIQLCSGPDPEVSWSAAEGLIARASEAGAALVVLPENVLTLGDPEARVRVAGGVLGHWGSRFAAAALRHQVGLVIGGVPETSADPSRPFNAAFAYGPDGQVLATYRKMHLFDIDLPQGPKLSESASTSAGDELALFELGGLRFGLSICYDLRFPELYRALVLAGAQVLLVPSAFTVPTGRAHWHTLLRARAIENQCYVVAPAQAGEHGVAGRASYGHTLIIDPWGEVIGERGEGRGLVLAELDLERLRAVREGLPCLRHLRPELSSGASPKRQFERS
ncbi:MAG: carbon-nitrogen hydrolase family protein [Myxococcales bacterium]|nr:carbon-nitrogen hydrolase family protein [Myxococcales bacterium]